MRSTDSAIFPPLCSSCLDAIPPRKPPIPPPIPAPVKPPILPPKPKPKDVIPPTTGLVRFDPWFPRASIPLFKYISDKSCPRVLKSWDPSSNIFIAFLVGKSVFISSGFDDDLSINLFIFEESIPSLFINCFVSLIDLIVSDSTPFIIFAYSGTSSFNCLSNDRLTFFNVSPIFELAIGFPYPPYFFTSSAIFCKNPFKSLPDISLEGIGTLIISSGIPMDGIPGLVITSLNSGSPSPSIIFCLYDFNLVTASIAVSVALSFSNLFIILSKIFKAGFFWILTSSGITITDLALFACAFFLNGFFSTKDSIFWYISGITSVFISPANFSSILFTCSGFLSNWSKNALVFPVNPVVLVLIASSAIGFNDWTPFAIPLPITGNAPPNAPPIPTSLTTSPMSWPSDIPNPVTAPVVPPKSTPLANGDIADKDCIALPANGIFDANCPALAITPPGTNAGNTPPAISDPM